MTAMYWRGVPIEDITSETLAQQNRTLSKIKEWSGRDRQIAANFKRAIDVLQSEWDRRKAP